MKKRLGKFLFIGAAIMGLILLFSHRTAAKARAGLVIGGSEQYGPPQMYGPPKPAGVAGGINVPVPVPSRKPAQQAVSYAKDRPLTEGEVYEIANYVNMLLGYALNPHDLLTSAFIESTFRPWVERYEPHLNDYSVGLMQVLIGTANDLYNKGWRAVGRPSRERLKDPVVSMYFGAAYFVYLRKYWPSHDLEWYVRAYNGGQGHNYNSQTTAYWNAWKAKRNSYSGVNIWS